MNTYWLVQNSNKFFIYYKTIAHLTAWLNLGLTARLLAQFIYTIRNLNINIGGNVYYAWSLFYIAVEAKINII